MHKGYSFQNQQNAAINTHCWFLKLFYKPPSSMADVTEQCIHLPAIYIYLCKNKRPQITGPAIYSGAQIAKGAEQCNWPLCT